MTKILGLDLGISSIGYAIVNVKEYDDNHQDGEIIKAGVRCFATAEEPKTGASLAEPRRIARGARRLLRRKSIRIGQIKALMLKHGVLRNEPDELDNLKKSPWEIRKAALSQEITPLELAKALLHIAKRRGFKSIRKSQEESDKGETGKLLKGVEKMKALFKERGSTTIGEMLADIPQAEPKRNKYGDYTNSIARELLVDEVKIIFEKQRSFNNPAASKDFEKDFSDIAFYQRPLESMQGMVGKCSFEPEQYRAPKNAYTAEIFAALCKINNIRLIDKGEERPLTHFQIKQVLDLCFEKRDNNYKQLRKILQLKDNIKFNISYVAPKDKNGIAKSGYDPEKQKIFVMKGYHDIAKVLDKKSQLWADIMDNPDGILDDVAEILSYYKTDDQIEEAFKKKGIKDEIVNKVKTLNFSKFMHLSIKAMAKINPFLEQGHRYDTACAMAGYSFQCNATTQKATKIPPLPVDDFSITSPVVKRTISQTIKVVNTLNRKYGPFDAVHVELAREMGKNRDDRKEIEAQQKANELERQKIKDGAIEGIKANTSLEIKKLRLWHQQGGRCIYSDKYINPKDILATGYTQIDHIIPYSISFDNSFNNLGLCLTAENQNKREQIPYDYFKQIGRNWQDFETKIISSQLIPQAKKNKLLKTLLSNEDIEGFKERNLSDTKHITRYIKNYLAQNLKLTDKYKEGVFTRNGRLTSDLRAWWGLNKERGESDRHHALDAIVLACCTNGMLNYISRKYKQKREALAKKDRNFVPQPWDNFRADTLKALNDIFVSRPPRRKVTGALHKDTYFSAKYLHKGFSVKREDINKLEISDIEKQRMLEQKYFGAQRNRKVYDAIEAALKERRDPKDPLSVYVDGIRVKKVRLIIEGLSGVKVLKGNAIAANGDMPRVDCFLKDGKYYLVPIYTIDFANNTLPLCSKPDNINMDIKDFIFSIYKDDYLEIIQKDGTVYEGYFSQYNASTGQILLKSHDRAAVYNVAGTKKNKKDINKNTFVSFKKYSIDLLGEKHHVEKEKYVGNIKKRMCFGGQ